MRLEDKNASGDGVTALALGRHAGGLLVVAGHASGQIRVWETRPAAAAAAAGSATRGGVGISWVLSKVIAGSHASTVSACCLVEGGPTTWALTADSHGRLVCHNINKHLSLAAQALAGFARK